MQAGELVCQARHGHYLKGDMLSMTAERLWWASERLQVSE